MLFIRFTGHVLHEDSDLLMKITKCITNRAD